MKINEEDDVLCLIKSKWINSQYDCKPKYYKECCQQGHDEKSCWNIHPELYDKYMDDKDANSKVQAVGEEIKEVQKSKLNRKKRQFNQQWSIRRNKYKRDNYGHIVGDIDAANSNDTTITNAFGVVTQEHNEEGNNYEGKEKKGKQGEQSMNEWVLNNFTNKTTDKE